MRRAAKSGNRAAAWAATLAARFWAKAVPEPTSGCFLWVGSVANPGGYGSVRVEGRLRPAHRVAWELANGPIPEGLFVCHRCDVRTCVNPSHLFLGPHQDNMDDMARKGRKVPLFGQRNGMRKHPERAPRFFGEDGPNSKLTAPQVLEIRRRLAAGDSQRSLAAEFGVHQSSISLIASRKVWGHLHAT